ncbi:DUF5684 domain-containing protein [Cellulomonas composti]|uniref:Signal peptidase I n=1 Tax=Cellulomonas composti TaxID=266130 RepID=A0A511J7N5_9CELL|nr:DUF5684 domain-containing protein [Cellulomonas composti]GEL94016.1 hypothetical protein CCO02nite_06740 [Cellulomonas composti]
MTTLVAALAASVTPISSDPNPGPALVGGLVGYLLVSLGIMGVFVKAGQPGWMGFVPILNTFVLLKVAGKPLWWFVLLLIPLVNLVVAILIWVSLSEAFGHGAGFAIGLLFLPVIFLWVLWLGSSRYTAPRGSAFA